MPLFTEPARANGDTFPVALAAEVAGAPRPVATAADIADVPAAWAPEGTEFFDVETRRRLRRVLHGGSLRDWEIDPVGQMNQPRPEWFGGVADGEIDAEGHVTGTDNAAAIEQCLQAFGSCYFGEGIYALSRYVAFVHPRAKFIGRGGRRERTTLALLDNLNINSGTLLPWGTYRPDAILVGSGSTDARVEGIHFWMNGNHRRVGNHAGYTQPHSLAISITGYGQTVVDCKVSAIAAASGGAGGVRTEGLPEAFVVQLVLEPDSLAPEAEDWVHFPGPLVHQCEFAGPICAQTDANDWASRATPEVTLVLIAGQGITWRHGVASAASESPNVTSDYDFFEPWMAGHVMTLGDEWGVRCTESEPAGAYERVKILSVNGPRSVTLEAATLRAWTTIRARVFKRTRRLYDQPEVSQCRFHDLLIHRSATGDPEAPRQLRAIHCVTMADFSGGTVEDNVGARCDAVFYYQDNAVANGLTIRNNRLTEFLYGFGMGMATYALSPAYGSVWWRNIDVYGNRFSHGAGAPERMWETFADYAATTNRMQSLMGAFANGFTLATSNPEQDWEDFKHPATATWPKQRKVVEGCFIRNNDWQSRLGYYNSGIFYFWAWSSSISIDYLAIGGNTLDHFVLNPETDTVLQTDSANVIRFLYWGPEIRLGLNERATGEMLPGHTATSGTDHWPPTMIGGPTGYSNDMECRFDWDTIGAGYNKLVPDAGGFIWYSSNEFGNASLDKRLNNIEWAGTSTYPLKLVMPRIETSGYGVRDGYARVGTLFELVNHGTQALTLYWNKNGTPQPITAVDVFERCRMIVQPNGYKWELIRPATSGSSV